MPSYTPGEGPLECTSCPAHSMLEGGLCMECLGAQYYDPLTQLCKNCNSECRRCSGPGKFSCVACAPPLHLDKLNNQCVPCCTELEKLSETDNCCRCDPKTGEFRCNMHAHEQKLKRAIIFFRFSILRRRWMQKQLAGRQEESTWQRVLKRLGSR